MTKAIYKRIGKAIFLLLFVILQIQTVTTCSEPETFELIIKNSTDSVLYCAVFDKEILPLIDWGPGTQNKIEIGGSRSFFEDDISGFTGNNNLVIYWWTLVQDDSLGYLIPEGFSHEEISASVLSGTNTIELTKFIGEVNY
jgi:hypothetical protein